jgi:RNA:NAD 2'-phosphotransferase (TPT1/KptA family)
MDKKLRIPEKVYHITKEDYVDSIFEKGLIRGENKLARPEDSEELHNYVTSDWRAILNSNQSYYPEMNLVVLEIDTIGMREKFQEDPSYPLSWFTDEVIEPSRIKVYCPII